MKQVRLIIVGFGTVGQGLAELLLTQRAVLQEQHALDIRLVGVANARHGFIYRADGLNIATVLTLAKERKPLTEHPDVQHWGTVLEGIQAADYDVMAEATLTNLRDAEPGLSYIRAALSKKAHVVTANKGPMALAAYELLTLAQQHGVQLRFEATVMAGTPVISTAREGMSGSRIQTMRGILNGTTNYILSAMEAGRDYAEVLTEAQAKGYAEADPTADVEGYDVMAKVLILAATVFGQPLQPAQVARTGITGVTRTHVLQAQQANQRIKLIAALNREGDHLKASIAPVALPLSDPLAHVEGTMNAITLHSDTLSAVTIIGPGAGRCETGQGLLADLIAVSRHQAK